MLQSIIFSFFLKLKCFSRYLERSNMYLAQITSSIIFISTLTILTGEKLNTSSTVNNFSDDFANPVIPMHYDIKLTLILTKYDSNRTKSSGVKNEYGSFLFYGKASITIHILRSTQNIKLHASNLGINNWMTTLTQNKDIIYKPDEFLYNTETNILDLHFLDVLSPGFYTLKMDLVGQITDKDTESFFRSSDINKEEDTVYVRMRIYIYIYFHNIIYNVIIIYCFSQPFP